MPELMVERARAKRARQRTVDEVVKRDGRREKFDSDKIARAVMRCFTDPEVGANPQVADEIGRQVARSVTNILVNEDEPATIEHIQRLVIRQLWAMNQCEAAEHYTLYREHHRKRRQGRLINPEHAALIESDLRHFPAPLQYYQFLSKFSRWRDDKGRRETWRECCDRVMGWFRTLPKSAELTEQEWDWLDRMLHGLRAGPAMRVVQMAGPALERCHVGCFNCAAAPIVDIQSLPELLYILMQGTGVGFSVEADFIDRMPRIKKQKRRQEVLVLAVEDSTEGWCEAYRLGLEAWFSGEDLQFDYSQIRPAGSRLRIKGGRSSGSGPLRDLLSFARELVLAAQGRQLTDLEIHDLCCMTGKIVQVGGVRRASLISLSDFDSLLMRTAKTGNWWEKNVYRTMANNSAVYDEKPSAVDFMEEWLSLGKSGSGERGIFNRRAVNSTSPERRKRWKFITNPCAEIFLRAGSRPDGSGTGGQMCNLSIVPARSNDDESSLREKVKAATYFGVLQSLATDFKYVREEWSRNCVEERLLGVDISGHADCPVLRFGAPGRAELLGRLKALVLETAADLAKRFGINMPAAATCIKPSGDSAEFFSCASGVSPRFSKWQIRRTRESRLTPMCKFLMESGVPWEEAPEDPSLVCFNWLKQSPEGSTTRDQMAAIDQLGNWLEWKRHWAEHSVSCFAGSERFFTDVGLARFDSFVDGQKVRVLNRHGLWTDAIIRFLGRREIWELIVERCGVIKVIRTTSDHLWPISYAHQRWAGYKPRMRRTDELASIIGNGAIKQLVTVNPRFRPSLDPVGVLHGIVFGDGSKRRKWDGNRKPFCHVYLYNDPNGVDKRKLSGLFMAAGYKVIEKDYRDHNRIYGLPAHWKDLPPIGSSPAYVRGFVAGWFATDGSYSDNGQSTISSTHREHLEWLQDYSVIGGVATSTHIKSQQVLGFAGPKMLYNIGLVKESLDSRFFVLEGKGDDFVDAEHAKYWRIVSAVSTRVIEPVYCAEVPKGQHFVLDGNILTHNCTIYVDDHEWFEVGNWVYSHFDEISGLSFLPRDNGIYRSAPNEELTKERYEELMAKFPAINWAKLIQYEEDDTTTASQTYACVGGSCEV